MNQKKETYSDMTELTFSMRSTGTEVYSSADSAIGILPGNETNLSQLFSGVLFIDVFGILMDSKSVRLEYRVFWP